MAYLLVFLLGILLGVVLGYSFLKKTFLSRFERWKKEFQEVFRREILERSRSILKGKIGEQMAPLLPMFKYEPADARFIGSPVDYIVFEGYAEGNPRSIVMVEVKTGKGKTLSSIERRIKELVEDGKVKWEVVYLEEIGAGEN